MASICINLTLKLYSNSVFYHSMDLCVLYSYSVLGKFDYIFLHIKELFLHFWAVSNSKYFILSSYYVVYSIIPITKNNIFDARCSIKGMWIFANTLLEEQIKLVTFDLAIQGITNFLGGDDVILPIFCVVC